MALSQPHSQASAAPAPPAALLAKRALRRRLRANRDSIDPAAHLEATGAIVARVLALLPQLPPVVDALGRPSRGVGLYHSLGSEVGTHALLVALTRRCMPVALPRVLHGPDDVTLRFGMVDCRTQLSASSWGVMEPSADHVARGTCLRRLQVILVPCVAFDAQGYRLGYGRGLYDRALANFGGHTLGLAFAAQAVPAVPHEPHDVPLHGIITEAGLVLPPASPLAQGATIPC